MLVALLTVATRALSLAFASRAAGAARGAASGAATRRQLEAAVPALYESLNREGFDNALPADLNIVWNPRLRRTAGRCRFLTRSHGSTSTGGSRRAEIELSPRVLDSPERLRITLAHELCHAAQWVVDGSCNPPHGERFWYWAARLQRELPDLEVTTRHSFPIFCRHQYACVECGQAYGRHSKSIDVRRRRCGCCGGALDYTGSFGRDGQPTLPRPQPTFASFVQLECARGEHGYLGILGARRVGGH